MSTSGGFSSIVRFTGSVRTRRSLFSFLRMHLNELLRFAHQEKSRRKSVLEMLPAFLLTRILKLICQFFHHGVILAAQLDRQQRQKPLHVASRLREPLRANDAKFTRIERSVENRVQHHAFHRAFLMPNACPRARQS